MFIDGDIVGLKRSDGSGTHILLVPAGKIDNWQAPFPNRLQKFPYTGIRPIIGKVGIGEKTLPPESAKLPGFRIGKLDATGKGVKTFQPHASGPIVSTIGRKRGIIETASLRIW